MLSKTVLYKNGSHYFFWDGVNKAWVREVEGRYCRMEYIPMTEEEAELYYLSTGGSF